VDICHTGWREKVPLEKTRNSVPLQLQAAAVVLLILGMLKLYAWSVPGLVSSTQDAVIPLPLNKLALLMGLIEVQFGILIIFLLRPVRGAQCLTLIGSGFIGYRWLHAVSAGPVCPCLAGATSLLPILRTYENKILLSLSIWFFLIGVWSWGMENRNA
jgi:uncharacterized protein YjeT (DUF2065 family)